MRTILACNGDYFFFFCPRCRCKTFFCNGDTVSDYDNSLEYDDYVGKNCLAWCGKCFEWLFLSHMFGRG